MAGGTKKVDLKGNCILYKEKLNATQHTQTDTHTHTHTHTHTLTELFTWGEVRAEQHTSTRRVKEGGPFAPS